MEHLPQIDFETCARWRQWAVVGDTFPVGCAYSDEIVFPEFFAANPDSRIPQYQTKYGIYEPHCGLDNGISLLVTMNISIRPRANIYPKKRNTCSGIIRFIPRTDTALTATS